MSKSKTFQLVEEKTSESSDKKNNSNKDKIIIELSNKQSNEDVKSNNSAEISGIELRKKTIEVVDSKNRVKQITMYKKEYEKYTERLKERTMRMEVDKMNNETERLKKNYEEKNSYLHSFDNNPQFQKMLKMVAKQLTLILIEGIIIGIFSSLLYFYITQRKEGLALSSFCISISEISLSIILFIGLKLGLLNEPDLSRAFRIFVFIESLLFVISFVINIIAVLVNIYYFKIISEFKIRIFIYLLLLLMIILFIIAIKYCLNLFVESVLILFKRKTEYSILMIKELKNKNDINFNTNLSTISNNQTTEGLNHDSLNILMVDNNANNKNNNAEEERYRTFNYFNKFHYSVSSFRNKDYEDIVKK